jgi:hypothetical protein
MEPPRFQIGDHVRTTRKLHRLPAGSIGTVVNIYGTDGLLGVLFPQSHVPRFVYRDQLELLATPEPASPQREDPQHRTKHT